MYVKEHKHYLKKKKKSIILLHPSIDKEGKLWDGAGERRRKTQTWV